MTFTVDSVSKVLLRLSAVVVIAAGASACSTMADLDPTGLLGGDNSQASNQTDDQTTTADNSQTPDLSTIPDKPAAPSTADEQKDVADSLASDRADAQYSADTLKGGTEAAAAPPPASPPPSGTEDVASNESEPTGAAPATPQAAPPQPAAAEPPAPSSAPGTLPSTAANESASAPAAAPTTQVATAEPPAVPATGGVPAVPAVPAAVAQPQTVSDASLGFHPSSAPPLDPSVAQFVPQPILSRYQQTASIGPAPAVPMSTPANTDEVAAAGPTHSRHHKAAMGVGGPEQMSGAVVANFDALQAGSVGPSVYAGSGSPAAVVFFPHDTTILSAAARAQVQAAARAFEAQGGQGHIRVVGHSSSRTANMPLSRHIVWNFERSQARANAVARELIHDGIPADRVLIEAVGDTQPVYYESMPQGEDGNRRAEIFIQG